MALIKTTLEKKLQVEILNIKGDLKTEILKAYKTVKNKAKSGAYKSFDADNDLTDMADLLAIGIAKVLSNKLSKILAGNIDMYIRQAQVIPGIPVTGMAGTIPVVGVTAGPGTLS